jgi:hypothetical protein
MHQITIIGVDPPCPRCKLLGIIMDEKVKELKIEAEVYHLTYTDDEARRIGQNIGLKTGTAKDVAKALNQEINNDRLNSIIHNKSLSVDTEFGNYNVCNWSPQLDEFLQPFEIKAKEAGILMTPVLVINGKVVHQGSVPSLDKINHWLMDLK